MPSYTIDLRQPATHFMFATVRIEATCADGSKSMGTGFFFNAANPADPERVYLCTNNHVLEDSVQVRFRMHISSKRNVPWEFSTEGEHWVTVNDPRSLWSPHPEADVDLCAVPISSVLAQAGQVEDLYYTYISKSSIPSADEQSRFPALMPISMIGYPTGLWDEQNNLPLLRIGTTASHPTIDFNGRAEVVIDMACFPGSSGSPVVFHDLKYFASAVRFLGVLYAGPTTTLEGEVILSKIPTKRACVEGMMHLGYVIKGSKVLELCNHIESSKGA
jgi:hypothetical protein